MNRRRAQDSNPDIAAHHFLKRVGSPTIYAELAAKQVAA